MNSCVTDGLPAAVEFGVKKNNGFTEGPDGLVYAARLQLSSATLNYLADLIRGHLKKIGSRWRAQPAGKIAGIVLAVLRCDQRPGDLAGGDGGHRTTRTRWGRGVVGLVAAPGPRPRLAWALRRRWLLLRHPHATVRFEGPCYLGPGFSLHIPDAGTFVVGPGVEFRRGFRAEISGEGRVTIGAGSVFTYDVL